MKTKKMIRNEIFLTLVLINLWAKENKENIIFVLIFIVNLIIKTFIDTWLTPHIMQDYGFPISFIATNIIYGLMGVFCVFWYDTLKKDWLMIEALKAYRSKGGHLLHKNKLVRFILKKHKWGDFVKKGLLFFKNPALYVIEDRDGIGLYNGFAGKNTVILYLAYLLIMNLYWNLIVYFSISFWKPIWEFIKFIIFINFKIYI